MVALQLGLLDKIARISLEDVPSQNPPCHESSEHHHPARQGCHTQHSGSEHPYVFHLCADIRAQNALCCCNRSNASQPACEEVAK
eukprot:74627-Chlamydomonas_euryale.AAC.3